MHTADTHYKDHHAPRVALRAHALIAKAHIDNGERPPEHIAKALTDPPKTATNDTEAYAYVNNGRWVVDCPFCSSAQLASASDPVYLCTDCANLDCGGLFVRVVWPNDDLRKAIERELDKRPIQYRNWITSETAEDLARENVEHGIVA